MALWVNGGLWAVDGDEPPVPGEGERQMADCGP
jgi:hypothetical protein